MECRSIRYAQHAFVRMFERGLAPASLDVVIANGEIIQRYPNDKPYPSVLILGFDGLTPIHVVVAQDTQNGDCVVVTAYRPDPRLWNADYRTRRTS